MTCALILLLSATPLAEESCQRCWQAKGMTVHKILFRFLPGRAPHGVPPEVSMCPCCDPLWAAAGERPLTLPASSARPPAQQMHPPPASMFGGAGATGRPAESDYAAALAGRKKKPVAANVGAAPGVSHISPHGGPPRDVDVPVCGCGVPGKQLTVSKEGPNKGRKFFSCAKPRCGSPSLSPATLTSSMTVFSDFVQQFAFLMVL